MHLAEMADYGDETEDLICSGDSNGGYTGLHEEHAVNRMNSPRHILS